VGGVVGSGGPDRRLAGVRSVVGVLTSPRLVPLHLLAVAAVLTASLLGLWQLEAWQAQRDAAARDLTALDPVALDDVLDADDPFPTDGVGRPVEVTGSWLPESTFLVSERELDGRDGFWVVTPAAVCGSPDACATNPALLVVRGWASGTDVVPPPPDGPVDLSGWLQPPEGSGRPDPDPSDDVLPELRIADAIQRVDQDLYGAYLVAERADPPSGTEALEPVTPGSLPAPGSSTGLRNLLYAVEWWVFGAFAAFVWWRWTRDEVERTRRPAAAPEDDTA